MPRISVHKGGTDVVSTRLGALANYLAVYRRNHPLADETVRLWVVGYPPGTAVRQMQRLTLFLFSALVAFAILDGEVSVITAVAGSLLVGLLLSGIGWKVLRSARSASPLGPIAVLLSDQRFTILQGVPGEDPAVLRESPPSAVASWSLMPVASRWLLRRQKIWMVRLDGPDGAVCSIEMGQVDPIALQAAFDESGLRRGD